MSTSTSTSTSTKGRGSEGEEDMAYQLFLASTVYKTCGEADDGVLYEDNQSSDSDYEYEYEYDCDYEDDCEYDCEDCGDKWEYDSDAESIDEDANDSVGGVVVPLMGATTPMLAPSEGFKSKYLALLLSLFVGVVLGVVATLAGLASLSAFLDEE